MAFQQDPDIDEIEDDDIDEVAIDEVPVSTQTKFQVDISPNVDTSPQADNEVKGYGFFRDLLDKVNTPLVNFGDIGPMPEARENLKQEHPFLEKVMGTGLDLASGLSSPLNIATEASFGLGAAFKAPGLIRAGQALSLPVVGEGINHIATGDSFGQKVMGGIELGTGLVGVAGGARAIRNSRMPPTTSPIEGFNPESPITPMFNGRNEQRMTGTIQDKPNVRLNPDGTYIETVTGDLFDPKNKTVVVNTTTPANVSKLKKLGYQSTGYIYPDGPYKGKAMMVKSDGITMDMDLPLPRESKLREAWNLSRSLMSVDLPFTTSAAFRQGAPHIGTKAWFEAWGKAAKAYGSTTAYDLQMRAIRESPNFRPIKTYGFKADGGVVERVGKSQAEKWGLRMTEMENLSAREEGIRSTWAESIPGYGRHVAGSNRAFTAFMNHIRATELDDLIRNAEALGYDPIQPNIAGATKIVQSHGMDINSMTPEQIVSTAKKLDPKFEPLDVGHQIAEYINNSTGRGTLPFGTEKGAQLLADVFFSPRLMASRINMLNPTTYVNAPPFLRKKYIESMARSIGMWWTIAGLAEMSGEATVSKDPTSADFGKIKFKNTGTRIDMGAGFQQFLVYAARMKEGGRTSSTSGKFQKFGEGFGAPTYGSNTADFFGNKLHPLAKLAYDISTSNDFKTVPLGDSAIGLFVPMFVQDIIEVAKTNPELLPITIPISGLGGGSQTYEGGPNPSTFTPLFGLDKYDKVFGGK